MMDNKLKPCSRCGSVIIKKNTSPDILHSYSCDDCGCRTHLFVDVYFAYRAWQRGAVRRGNMKRQLTNNELKPFTPEQAQEEYDNAPEVDISDEELERTVSGVMKMIRAEQHNCFMRGLKTLYKKLGLFPPASNDPVVILGQGSGQIRIMPEDIIKRNSSAGALRLAKDLDHPKAAGELHQSLMEADYE